MMDNEYFSYKKRAVDALCKFFSFRLQRSTKRLMNLKCGDDDERYAKKAVETLVKKLKKSALEDLESALNNPEVASKCVLMTKSDDKSGVNQKALPHVVYCRIWRWPDLKSHHELQSIEACEYPCNNRSMQTEFCINPYHYKRLMTPELPPVIIPKPAEFSPERIAVTTEQIIQHQHSEQQLAAQSLPYNVTVPPEYNEQNTLLSDAEQILAAMFPYLQNDNEKIAFSHDKANDFHLPNKPSNTNPFLQCNFVMPKSHDVIYDKNCNHLGMSTHYSRSIVSTDYSASTFSSSTSTSSSSYNSTGTSNFSTSSSGSDSCTTSSTSSDDTLNITSFCSSLSDNTRSIVNSTINHRAFQSRDQNSNKQYHNGPKCQNDRAMQNNKRSSISNDSSSNRTVYYEEQEYWASIVYYELNSRVGEPYLCKYPVVIIDGYTSPNDPNDQGNRLCLGTFSNIYRNPTIDNTRQHIGKGIHLHHVSNGVILQVFSHSPVFVQSRICNYLHGLHYNTVCKILPGGSLKIFDFMVFANLLSNCVHHGFEAVYELTKMCTIRISFAKGWGADYHRQDVTSTPCWIEIHVYGALKWLDNVLTQMDRPASRISSVT